MEKLFCSVIKEFEKKMSGDELHCIDDFFDFSSKRFRFMEINSANNQCIDKFLFMWIPKKVTNSEDGQIEKYVKSINSFSKYIRENYDVIIDEKTNYDISEIKRICGINNEFKRFLYNPVISYSPMIIDFDIYKKKRNMLTKDMFFTMTEEGYFTLEEIFRGDFVILKKMYTGRFIKVAVDKNIANKVKKGDVLFASLRQNPFFSWEFVELYKYYSSNVLEYIKANVTFW